MNKFNITDDELKEWAYKVSKEFYELVYEHPWLKQVFKDVKQEVITAQQADFALGALGGPKIYSGRSPSDAHPHIFIDEEMWQVREDLLIEAFKRVNCPEDIQAQWLRIDEAFKKSIVMKDPSECQRRFLSDDLIIIPNPDKNKDAA